MEDLGWRNKESLRQRDEYKDQALEVSRISVRRAN